MTYNLFPTKCSIVRIVSLLSTNNYFAPRNIISCAEGRSRAYEITFLWNDISCFQELVIDAENLLVNE